MLKVFAYGTDYFVDTYAKGLIQDCKKFNYELTLEKVSEGSFSVINHAIHQKMLQVVKEAGNQDRILFLDPECRIIKPIPQHWIEDKSIPFNTALSPKVLVTPFSSIFGVAVTLHPKK